MGESKNNNNLSNENNLEESNNNNLSNENNLEESKNNNNLSNENNLEESKNNNNLSNEDNSKENKKSNDKSSKKKMKYPEVYFTDENNNSIKALIKHSNKIKANIDGNEVVGQIIGNTKDKKKLFFKYGEKISEIELDNLVNSEKIKDNAKKSYYRKNNK